MTYAGICQWVVVLFFGMAVIQSAPAQDETTTVATTKHSVATATGSQDSGESPADSKYGLEPGEDPDNHLVVPFLKHIGSDQKEFWTSPAHFKIKDLKWIAPTAGITAALIASDSWMSKQIPNQPNQLNRSLNVSDYSLYSMIGIGGGSYLLGEMTHNDHLSETGLLSGEAAIDATGVTYLLKGITQRERPNSGTGDGRFFQGGQSFPSEHSAIAWSIASVWAHEYPSTLSQILAYGLASTVTITRVTSQQHFSSDVFIGGALGWYFGRQVYRSHHDQTLGGAAWGDLFARDDSEKTRDPKNMGSPYVPLDSWVYPTLERLAALGYIHSEYLGMRPWTRMECARLLEEAGDQLADDAAEESAPAGKLYRALQTEFEAETGRLDGAENLGASLDSVYTRATEISGKPLTDGYHFGQTIVNDYGRPYGQGFNNVTGFTSHAVAGPLSISVQGEYQHAPAVASDPPSVLQATAQQDETRPFPNGVLEVNRFRLLDSLVSLTFKNTQFSFGKQSLWLGPGQSGPLLMSDNAAPFAMFRIASVSPEHIPYLSDILGPAQTEFFLGQLSGHRWEFDDPNLLGPTINPQPFVHGEKISFKPTANFEFGMGITAMFAGPGLPFTWSNFLRTYYAHTPNNKTNPGKRTSTADFSYRVPTIRKWLTVYMDSMVVDEVSPIGSTRATVNPGIYMPQMPWIPKLELRAEGIHESLTHEFGPGFIYIDSRRFRGGYTNDGNLMGSWIGRAGLGGQGWLTYSFSPNTSLQFAYRHQEAAKGFIGGGHLNDYSAAGRARLSSTIALSGSVQYEQWMFPVLNVNRQTDVVASFELAYHPKRIQK